MLEKYHKIIASAKGRDIIDKEYYEKHHIIPKSIYNNKFSHNLLNLYEINELNDKNNIVYLTAQEHLSCHLLLPYIFKDKNTDCYIKMLYASQMMSYRVIIEFNDIEGLNLYSELRLEFSAYMSENLKGKPSRQKGNKWTKEQKKNKSDKHYMKNKSYEEIYGVEEAERLKQIRREGSTDRVCTEESRLKMSKVERTPEWNAKISCSKMGVSPSAETRVKLKNFFGNSLLNPIVDQTLYLFKNIKTNETIIARKYDMKKLYGVASHHLIRGTRKHVKGWYIECRIPYSKKMKGSNICKNPIMLRDSNKLYEMMLQGEYKEYEF